MTAVLLASLWPHALLHGVAATEPYREGGGTISSISISNVSSSSSGGGSSSSVGDSGGSNTASTSSGGDSSHATRRVAEEAFTLPASGVFGNATTIVTAGLGAAALEALEDGDLQKATEIAGIAAAVAPAEPSPPPPAPPPSPAQATPLMRSASEMYRSATQLYRTATQTRRPIILPPQRPPPAVGPLLVVYAFANTTLAASDNLRFFIKHGMRPHPDVDHAVIVQLDGLTHKACSADGTDSDRAVWQEAQANLPLLPERAQYYPHANECYDLGSFGWFFRCGHAMTSLYRYFLFVNSSVRGPYLPAYAEPLMHWSLAFTKHLTPHVKLVGCTINCELRVHVQSYVLATDAEGLAVLNSSTTFTCHPGRHHAIRNGELSATASMFAANYSVKSLQVDQARIDWIQEQKLPPRYSYCRGARVNPTGVKAKRAINPYEVLFMKFKSVSDKLYRMDQATFYSQFDNGDGDGRRRRLLLRSAAAAGVGGVATGTVAPLALPSHASNGKAGMAGEEEFA